MGEKDVPLVNEVPSGDQHLPGAGCGDSEVFQFGSDYRVIRYNTIKHACLILSEKGTTTGSATGDLVPVGRLLPTPEFRPAAILKPESFKPSFRSCPFGALALQGLSCGLHPE